MTISAQTVHRIRSTKVVQNAADGQFDKETWRKIFGAVYTDGEAYRILQHLCDKIGPRMSCTENGRKAEEYAHKKFEELGLENVHFEPFKMLGWERGDLTVEVTAPQKRKLRAIALGNTPSTSQEGLEGEVFDVGFGTPDEFEKHGAGVKGKIVLCMNGAPQGHRGVHRSEKMSLCHKYGATAMIMINSTHGNVPQAGTVAIGRVAPLPGVSVSREEGEWIRRLIEGGEKVKMFVKSTTKYGEAEARNVVAEIKGASKPEEVVIIGAHLDSWDLAQGAIDNGIGSASVLEVARVLNGLKKKPARTIRFILFMGEEFGLNGSKAYVRAHQSELPNIAMVLNLDMVGSPTGYKLYACDEAKPFFSRLARELSHAGMTDAVEVKAGLHSDHQPFMLAGVPACQPNSTLDDEQGKYYHSAGDTFDKAREKPLNECAAIAAVTLWELANVSQRPAPFLKPEVVRERMIRDGIQEALQLAGEWPWDGGSNDKK